MAAKRIIRRNMWPFGTNQPLGPVVYHGKRTRAAAGGVARAARPVSAKAAAKAERESEAQRRGRKLSDPNLESKLKSWYAKGGSLNEFLQANPSYRKYFDEDSEGKSKAYRSYQVWPVRDGWKTSLSVLPTFASEAAAKKFVDAQLAKKNPAEAAAEVYEEFHGMPSAEIIEVTRKVHYHEHLAALGKLEALVVRCLDGYERRLVGFKNAKLCSNEQKNQLFVEGGDQTLDSNDYGFRDWPHEMNTLGLVIRLEYFTTKTHLGSEGGTAIYFHEPGKAERGQSAGVGPDLIYDAPNEALLFSGGTYLIKREGIDK
jgi:hypothetical protein